MPTSSASDSSDRPTTSDSKSSAPLCPECGARLSAGACPACALGQLLGGKAPETDAETAAQHRVEEHVEFGRYTLKQRLAAGGMGIVYVAEDRKLKRTVALKMIRGSTFADDGEVARFTLEAEAAAALDHPNIVPIYEVGRMDGQPFFTMKLIEGVTLAQRMKDHGGTLPAREVAQLLSQIARAVHHAHQRGVLHRDLKPGNILLDAANQPWLTDFGLAKLATSDSSLTLTRDHIGTPHYMAPEVAGGNARAVSTASDVWALGVMLWEMLCGVPPFHGPGPVEIMRRIVESEPNWPAGSRADGDLVTIARRCMEKTPGRRPQSALEVAEELERWLRGEPIKARPVTRRERFIKWVRREPAMAALYAVFFIAMMAGLLLWNRAEHAVVSLRDTNVRMEENLRIATATKLAGDARLQVEENPSRALLLAVESAEMTEPERVLPESAAALTDVLQRTGGLDATAGGLRGEYREAWIFTGQLQTEACQVSPDSRWLLSVDYSRQDTSGIEMAVYDLHDRERAVPLRRWRLKDDTLRAYFRITWRWRDDSRHVLFADFNGKVFEYDVITPEMTQGQVEGAEPQAVVLGSVGEEGKNLQRMEIVAAGRGKSAVISCWYREQADKVLSKTYFRRCELTPDGVKPGALHMASRMTLNHFDAPMLPDTKRVLFNGPDSPGFAELLNMERPDDPPVVIKGTDNPYAVTLRPDGRMAAVRARDSSLWLVDLPESGSTVREVTARRLPGLAGTNEVVAFSQDGNWLAVGGRNGVVKVLPIAAGGRSYTLHLDGRCLCLAFSGDGKWLAAGGTMRTVYAWRIDDIQNSPEPVILRGNPTYISSISFSPDGKNIIATGGECAARRWPFDSVSGNAQPRHLEASSGAVADIAISPDQEWVAAACIGEFRPGENIEAGYVTLARANGRSYTILGKHANRSCSVAFSRNGRWLVSTGHDNAVRVWDFPALKAHIDAGGSGPVEPRFVLPVEARATARYSVTFHPGDGCLYQVNCDGVLYAWDLSFPDPDAGHQEDRIHSKGYLLPDVIVSPDGHYLAVARHAWDEAVEGSPQHGNQVLLFDVSQYSWPPKFITALTADFLEETNLSFSPDSRWLAAGGEGKGVSVWDLKAPDMAASRRVSTMSAQSNVAVGFSPDGKSLAYGGNDGRLHLWNWQTPGDPRVIQTGSAINTLAWFDDGHIATAGGNSRIMLWDTSIPRLKDLARRVAGRELSEAERARFRITRP